MKAVGKQGNWESRTEAKVLAPAEIATRLGIGEGDLCGHTVYEFLADGKPVQLSTSWEPYDLTAGTLVDLPEGGPHAGAGVVNRMAAIGITVSHAVEQPEPRQASAEEASLLGLQRTSWVTHIRRTYYSDQGQPVETADIVVPAALCEIVYEVPISRLGDRPEGHQCRQEGCVARRGLGPESAACRCVPGRLWAVRGRSRPIEASSDDLLGGPVGGFAVGVGGGSGAYSHVFHFSLRRTTR